jgi:hypothetical protein
MAMRGGVKPRVRLLEESLVRRLADEGQVGVQDDRQVAGGISRWSAHGIRASSAAAARGGSR